MSLKNTNSKSQKPSSGVGRLRLVILGGGESGVGAAILAKKKGLEVFVSDSGEIKEKYKNVLKNIEIEWEEGKHTEAKILNATEVVKSPGIPDNIPLIKQLKKQGVPVISEIEFAGRYTNAKIIGITGSNGKTTTTLLTYHMLKKAGLNVGLAGNVGESLAKQVAEDDKGFYVLMGNNHYLMRAIAENEPEKMKAFVGWLLCAAKGYTAKLVNPGGVEVWKSRQAGNVSNIDSTVEHFGVTPRQIIRSVAGAVDELRLPHSVHIHANNLGMPGNWTTTLETMQALEGHRGHITHIQFHSYAGGDGDEETFGSRVTELAEYVNSHDNITVDVGQDRKSVV